MKLCLSQVTILGTPTEKAVEAAAHAGFGHIDLWWPQIRSETEPPGPARLREFCEAQRVDPSVLSGLNLELAGDDEAWESSLAEFRAAQSFAREARIQRICFSPGVSAFTRADLTFATAAGRLAEVLDSIDRVPLELSLEFRAHSGWMASLPTALAFVMSFDSADRLGICFDAFHYYCGPSKLEDLTSAAIEKIRIIQLSDLIAATREFAIEDDRILPGEGDFDLGPVLGCFQAADYNGLICAEAPNPMLWQFAPDRVADMARQSLLRFFVTAESNH